MAILAIETSCDDTAVAVYDEQAGLLGHLMHSQIALHAQYGGVVPELASRDHIKKLLPMIQQLLSQLNLTKKDVTGIAYTKGPGLIGSLMVGASVARSLAFAWGVPSLGVHHLESHLMAVLLEEKKPVFPFVTLLVSGGHTMLLYAKAFGNYQILGDTLDDAAGEAFDKTAKLLGLGYPGGPEIAALAKKGNTNRFHFPRPMINRPGLDFSFSGLKTFAMNTFEKAGSDAQTKADIACAFEDAVIDTLIRKCERALKTTDCQQLVIAGGVSANEKLREQVGLLQEKGVTVFFPRREFCTDNAAMVACNGFERFKRGEEDALDAEVKARWSIETLT